MWAKGEGGHTPESTPPVRCASHLPRRFRDPTRALNAPQRHQRADLTSILRRLLRRHRGRGGRREAAGDERPRPSLGAELHRRREKGAARVAMRSSTSNHARRRRRARPRGYLSRRSRIREVAMLTHWCGACPSCGSHEASRELVRHGRRRRNSGLDSGDLVTSSRHRGSDQASSIVRRKARVSAERVWNVPEHDTGLGCRGRADRGLDLVVGSGVSHGWSP